jgi:hypothetical protein
LLAVPVGAVPDPVHESGGGALMTPLDAQGAFLFIGVFFGLLALFE